MRKVFENRTAGTLDTERVVRLYTGGVREVVKGDWDGEWWNRYVIIPRRLVINEIRKPMAVFAVGGSTFMVAIC